MACLHAWVQRKAGIRPTKLAVLWLQVFPFVDSFLTPLPVRRPVPRKGYNASRWAANLKKLSQIWRKVYEGV